MTTKNKVKIIQYYISQKKFGNKSMIEYDLNVDLALKLRIYRSLKSFTCLKWILKNLSTTLHTQFNYFTKPVCPFKKHGYFLIQTKLLTYRCKSDMILYLGTWNYTYIPFNYRLNLGLCYPRNRRKKSSRKLVFTFLLYIYYILAKGACVY